MSTQETAPTLFLEANGTNFAYRVIGSPVPALAPLLLLNHFRSNIDLVSRPSIRRKLTHQTAV